MLTNNITDEQKPATALEVHVLTKSSLLEGKGICITVVDDQVNLLSEETHAGTDPVKRYQTCADKNTSDFSIQRKSVSRYFLCRCSYGHCFVLCIVSYRARGRLSKLKHRVLGKYTPQSGYIVIIHLDGSWKTVKSSNQNCLFHAVIQATTNDGAKQKAVEPFSKVGEKVSHY